MNGSIRFPVIIDGRPLVGNRTGIGVHTAEIAGRLSADPPPIIASHKRIDDRQGIEHCHFVVDPAPLGVLWQQAVLPSVIAREKAEVLWAPHGTLPIRTRVRAVVTVHDLTSMTLPTAHRIRTILSFNTLIGRSLKQSTAIAAVSRATAQQVMKTFQVPSTKITIVPNGVDPFFAQESAPGEALPSDLRAQEYVLYVGTIEPRKGIGELIAAWSRLAAPRPRLVLCGDPGWGNRRVLQQIIPFRQSGEIVSTGFVSRSTLRALYRNALLFVYPSYYEGFGLPVLEAMAAGTPVITTTAGAIPEVAGEAGILVQTRSADALLGALERLLSSEALRTDLRARGRLQAQRFRWDVSAGIMADLLNAAGRR